MALLFMDSFDHVSSVVSVHTKWGTGTLHPANWNGSAGRFGTAGISFTFTRYIGLTPSNLGTQTTVIIGMALYYGGANGQFLQFYDSVGGGYQVSLGLNSSNGVLTAYRGLGTTVLGSTPIGTFSNGRWYYIEVKVTIDNSTGVVNVRKDGTSVLNLTSQDTQTTANATLDTIYVGQNPTEYFNIDDVYVLNTTGSAPTNDFLGDVRVNCLFPSGNGNSSQFMGSDGNSTDNYLLVDETGDYDGDTTYVESDTVSQKDTYAYTNLASASGTVYGVQLVPIARKTDSGPRSIATVARLSATEVDSANITLAYNYIYARDIRETKPGGGAWTVSDVNDAEFGYKVTV